MKKEQLMLEESPIITRRIIWCDGCEAYRYFNTKAFWFSCNTCHRCFTCLKQKHEKCSICIEYDRHTKEMLRDKAKGREVKDEVQEEYTVAPCKRKRKLGEGVEHGEDDESVYAD